MKTAKHGKAAGPDGIPAEILKDGGDEVTHKLLDLFQKIWDSETLLVISEMPISLPSSKRGTRLNVETIGASVLYR